MKLFGLGFTIIFFFATTGPLSADKVYTWTDKDGNLHITDQPPPEGATVRNVIKYKPQSEKEVQEIQRQQQMRENAVDRKQKLEETQNAKLKAQKAAEEAKIARDKADAAVKDAKGYIDTHDRNQYMRRAYKYEMKKKVCFAFGEKGHLASRQLHMSGHGSAARRFVLICGYLCKSVSPKSLSNNRNILKL